MDMSARVGIVDSGGPAASLVGARRVLVGEDGAIRLAPPRPDRLGHGSRVEAVLRRSLPELVPLHVQVFDDRPVTSPARVVAALDWLVGEAGVGLVCLSLGLPQDRAVLRDAVARAVEGGAILVAASPAQGNAVCYPAAYPGVVAATGDARCGFDDITLLGTPDKPVFGAWCASPEQDGVGMPSAPGGASIACARVTGHVAALIRDGKGNTPTALDAALRARVRHEGREVRRAGA